MQNIILAADNNFDTGASWYGDELGALNTPLSKLSNAVFSDVWKYQGTLNADGNTTRFAASVRPFATGHLALCRHNLSKNAQIRLRAGTARFDADFLTDNPFTHDVLFGGGANGTRTNEYGLMEVKTCPRYQHDRRYPANGFIWSEDISNTAAWARGNCFVIDSQTVDFPAAGGSLTQGIPTTYADTYEESCQIRLLSGNGDFAFTIAGTNSATQTATTDWKTFRVPIVAVAGQTSAGIVKQTAGGVLQVRKLQHWRGASSDGKYRKTTVQRRYQRIGLISEASSTNQALWSNDFSNGAWVKASVTMATDTVVGLDGTLTGDALNGSTVGSTVSQDFTVGGTSTRAASFIFQAGGSCTSAALRVVWQTGGTTQSVQCNFNPATGAFLNSGGGVGATLLLSGVKDIGGGYFVAYVAGTGTSAANTKATWQLFWNVTGTINAWGAQHEPNAVTTFIYTTSAAVTRSVDTAVVEATTWVPYVFNAAEGTIYHEVMFDDVPSVGGGGITGGVEFSNPGGTNKITARMLNSNVVDFTVTSAGSSVLDTADTSAPAAQVARQALRYRSNDWQSAGGGVLKTASGSVNVPTGITSINLLALPSSTNYLRRVAIWPTGKPNADLQALTATGPSAIDHDSGWQDVLQAVMRGDVAADWGLTYNIIRTFTSRLVEWFRVEIYDPEKTYSGAANTSFSIGRAFSGRFIVQPAVNASFGKSDGWRERSPSAEASSGRMFFNERARMRDTVFSFRHLSADEGDAIHEMKGSKGTISEVLMLPDADDLPACQRLGFVGYLKDLDRIAYPNFGVRETAFQLEMKR